MPDSVRNKIISHSFIGFKLYIKTKKIINYLNECWVQFYIKVYFYCLDIWGLAAWFLMIKVLLNSLTIVIFVYFQNVQSAEEVIKVNGIHVKKITFCGDLYVYLWWQEMVQCFLHVETKAKCVLSIVNQQNLFLQEIQKRHGARKGEFNIWHSNLKLDYLC